MQGAARRGLEVVERGLRLALDAEPVERRALELLRVDLLFDAHRYREARAGIEELRPTSCAMMRLPTWSMSRATSRK